MKTKAEIEAKLAALMVELAKPCCPCNCEDDGWYVTRGEVETLRWVLNITEPKLPLYPTRSE